MACRPFLCIFSQLKYTRGRFKMAPHPHRSMCPPASIKSCSHIRQVSSKEQAPHEMLDTFNMQRWQEEDLRQRPWTAFSTSAAASVRLPLEIDLGTRDKVRYSISEMTGPFCRSLTCLAVKIKSTLKSVSRPAPATLTAEPRESKKMGRSKSPIVIVERGR